MSKIDFSTHIFPSPYVKELAKTPSDMLSMGRQFYDVGFRLKLMDKYGIDKQVLSLSSQGLASPEGNFIRMIRAGNDGISDIVKKYPERFIGMGTFNHLESPEVIDELDRCIDELHFGGVMVHTNQFGKPLDVPEFDEFFSRVEHHNIPLLIHPRSWNYFPWIAEHKIDMILGWPFETGVAILRCIMEGFFDRHSKLKIVTHHAGGILPFFANRIEGIYQQGIEYKAMDLHSLSKNDPTSYLKHIFYDTAVYGSVAALSCAISVEGYERMMFGTDYPFGPESGEKFVRQTVKSIDALGLSESQKHAIFVGNAEALMNIN